MTESDRKKITTLTCPRCKGTGFLGLKKCPECRRISSVSLSGGKIHYWGLIIDTPHIFLYKTQRRFNHAVNIVLLVFGCIGIGILFWEFIKTSGIGTIWFFWNTESPILIIFWLSLLIDSYLFYRYSKQFSQLYTIPKKIEKALTKQGREEILSWNEVSKAPLEDKIDIAKLYSEETRNIVIHAYEVASKYRHFKVGPVHLLIALLSNRDIINVFVRLGISFNALKSRINHILPHYRVPTKLPLHFTAEFQKILFTAYEMARINGEKKVRPKDLFVALFETSEVIREVLYDLEIDRDKIINVTEWVRFQKDFSGQMKGYLARAALRPKSSMNRSMTAIATPILDRYSQDLTSFAQRGLLEPCVGRKKEIDEIFRVIKGGSRQSVIMVGPPGVGKKTIANGIAYLMVGENVPPLLQDKRLISLDIARLTSGANPAEASQRLLVAINEIRRSGNIAVFIDNVSKLIGISQGGQASLDLAEVLAQALSKRQLIAITTASPQDYTKYIENKSGLYQVLEKISVPEVSGNDAIQVLESKSFGIEAKYGVFFSYDAIEKSIQLSNRYMHERYLPEKAIEILEETAAFVVETKGKDTVISGEDVAGVISSKTEIPLTEITKSEGEKLLNLEDEIHQYMVDQKEAVRMVATAIRRARAEMRDLSRPIVNLLFLGPTGVGKTELAKTIIRVYFKGDEKEMIRLDMSEYQEKSSINRLIGAPPGSGSSSSGGYLTENVRKNPFSLVLLDEIEKAHPEILNIFLQVMDDGRLTDSEGRTIDFTNVIIIATSNASSITIQKQVEEGRSVEEIKNHLMEGELQKYFRPELLNRFDGIIVFKPLNIKEVQSIARLMLKKIEKSLSDKGVTLEATDGAIEELAEAGFDPKFGARPLRRIMQEKINDVLANYFLAGKVGRRDKILLDVGGRVEIIKAKKL